MARVLLIICLLISLTAKTQSSDSLPKKQTTAQAIDTPKPAPVIIDSNRQKDTTQSLKTIPVEINNNNEGFSILQQHPLLNKEPAIYSISKINSIDYKDELFYLVAGIAFLLAFIRAVFPKYFNNIFVIFFQTNFRQKQTKEQLLQDNIAATLLNILFIISLATYGSLLMYKFQVFNNNPGFWKLLWLSLGVLCSIYLFKFVFIHFLGFIFRESEASQSYMFIVFLINKMIGVMLVPVIAILTFSAQNIVQPTLTISIVIICILIAYRLLLTFKSAASRLNINLFQFFLYFCGVEVLPLLLLYKISITYIL